MVAAEPQQIQLIAELLPRLSRSMVAAVKGFGERTVEERPEFMHSTALLKVLMLLNTKGSMTVGEIAGWLNVSPSTASEHLDRFVEAQLVERRVNPEDRRQVLVGITGEGKRLIQPCADYLNDRIQSALEQFDEQELAVIMRAITALVGSFESDARTGYSCPLDGN